MTLMNRNSEVMRCSLELKSAFKQLPQHHKKHDPRLDSLSAEQKRFEDECLDQYLRNLKEDFGYEPSRTYRKPSNILNEGKFDRMVRMTMEFQKERDKRGDLADNEDLILRETPALNDDDKKFLMQKIDRTVEFEPKSPNRRQKLQNMTQKF